MTDLRTEHIRQRDSIQLLGAHHDVANGEFFMTHHAFAGHAGRLLAEQIVRRHDPDDAPTGIRHKKQTDAAQDHAVIGFGQRNVVGDGGGGNTPQIGHHLDGRRRCGDLCQAPRIGDLTAAALDAKLSDRLIVQALHVVSSHVPDIKNRSRLSDSGIPAAFNGSKQRDFRIETKAGLPSFRRVQTDGGGSV